MNYEFKGTGGEWKVQIDGTCTGSDFEVYVEAYDIGEHENFNYVIATTDTCMTNSSYDAKSYQTSTENWVKEPNYDELEANAHLIAAAPDLLKVALETLWDMENGEAEAQKQGKPRLTERKENLIAAIHKALNIQ